MAGYFPSSSYGVHESNNGKKGQRARMVPDFPILYSIYGCGGPEGQFVSTLCFNAKSTKFKNLKGS